MPNIKSEENWIKPTSRAILITNNDAEIQILAITVSALLHLVLIFLVYLNFSGIFSSEIISPQNSKVLAIKLLPPREINQKQITSDSEQINKITPRESYKEAEQNNSILEQRIKRGDGGTPKNHTNLKVATATTKTVQKPIPPKKNRTNDVSKEKISTGNLKKKDIPAPKIQQPIEPNKESLDLKTQTQNNLNAALAGSMFSGTGGSPDLLPNVREGEITLLNTKASKYAVFVRRVALQVFNDLKTQAWKKLNYQEIQKILGNATVIAKLDPKGNLISTKLVSNSGSEIFNQLIHNSVKEKARDPHPPESALVDNQFHFIFQTKMTSGMSPSRGGGYAERRWLILSVGLE